MRKKTWTKNELVLAVKKSFSVRQVLKHLKLREAGGNYLQIKKYLTEYNLDISHFRGQCWNKGLSGIGHFRISLEKILVQESNFQSFKLKKRLFLAGLKKEKCEICGWTEKSLDGRVPVELDHINGNNKDNRLENIRILCPNCHSLQATHRGKNIKIRK